MIAALAALAQWRRANGGAPLPLVYREGADLVARTLDGVPFTGTDHDGGASLPTADGGYEANASPASIPLISAARSMQRANARLAAASRQTATQQIHS